MCPITTHWENSTCVIARFTYKIIPIDILDSEVLTNGYNLIRKDGNCHGGGVLTIAGLYWPPNSSMETL